MSWTVYPAEQAGQGTLLPGRRMCTSYAYIWALAPHSSGSGSFSFQRHCGCGSFSSPTRITSVMTEFSRLAPSSCVFFLCQLAPGGEEVLLLLGPVGGHVKGSHLKGLIWDLQNSKHKIASHSSRGDHNSLRTNREANTILGWGLLWNSGNVCYFLNIW